MFVCPYFDCITDIQTGHTTTTRNLKVEILSQSQVGGEGMSHKFLDTIHSLQNLKATSPGPSCSCPDQ